MNTKATNAKVFFNQFLKAFKLLFAASLHTSQYIQESNKNYHLFFMYVILETSSVPTSHRGEEFKF